MSYRRIVAAHLAGNALLLWMGYYWLGIGEGGALSLIWGFLVASAIAIAAVCLHGGAFAYFAGSKPQLRRLAPLLGAVVALGVVYLLLSMWSGYSAKPAFRIASWLTMKLHKPVKPASVARIFNAALWLVRWMVVPVLALPIVAWTASGLRGAVRNWKYWIEVPLLLVAAFWIPFRLWGWVPHMPSFAMELISFALRIAVAYVCFVASWLVLVWLSARGPRPAAT
jgi:hypothetical protein